MVRAWAVRPAAWLVIHPDRQTTLHCPRYMPVNARPSCWRNNFAPTTVILDELAARALATQRGHKVVGLLGLLAHAADAGLINLGDAIARLRQTSFRASPHSCAVCFRAGNKARTGGDRMKLVVSSSDGKPAPRD